MLAAALTLAAALDFGPHAVGFETIFARDHSRAALAGGSGRLVPVYVWYPARQGQTKARMQVRDYIHLMGRYVQETRSSETDRRGREVFAQAARELGGAGSAEHLEAIGAMPARAVEGGRAVEGRHPLFFFLDYRPPATNSIHGEYLASHGFVVASTPMLGTFELDYDNTLGGMETQVASMRVAIDQVAQRPYADVSRLAVGGVGIAANICLAYITRNPEVDAMVSLDGGIASPFEVSLMRRTPYYDPAHIRLPMLVVEAPFPGMDRSLHGDYRYSDRRIVHFPTMKEFHFLNYGMFEAKAPRVIGDPPPQVEAGFTWALRSIRAFLEQQLKGTSWSLDPSSAEAGLLEISHVAALPQPPRSWELRALIEREGVGAAKALYEQLSKNHPQPFAAATLINLANFFGYGKDQDWSIRRGLMEIYTQSYPHSARGHFAMANTCQNRQEKDCAITHYQKAMELLAADYDPTLDNAFRERIARLSRERIEQLRAQ